MYMAPQLHRLSERSLRRRRFLVGDPLADFLTN